MKKRCFLNRRGYFFLIDSVLALTVLAMVAFLIFSLYSNVPQKEEPAILSDDLMDFFANNKIKDIDNPYAGLGGTLWKDEGGVGGLCPGEELTANAENTLLQQAAEFYEKSKNNSCYLNLALKFITELTQGSLPLQFNFEFWLDDQLLYPDTEQVASKNAAKVIIPSKKMVYGISNKDTGDMFGPYNAEVIVWR
ncbi:MAG: hypothetical protein IIB81_03305 [Nanoarchaeota archaeon]|nr:hypothetical protein [Nanoarchaeota archaeon]